MTSPSIRLYDRYCDFELLIDSRRLTDPAKSLFLALPGNRTDGHHYLPELLRAGVRHFLIREDFWIKNFEQPDAVNELSLYTDATFIAVEDVVVALGELAAEHRRQFDIPVIGITGSNGKTVVKDWLSILLAKQFNVCSSPRSYNSRIGVPLSVWQLRPEHDIAVFEAGISTAGEMEWLAKIIQPTHGIFTNLGEAHAAGFQNAAHKLSEKLKLFEGVTWLLTYGEDQLIQQAVVEQSIPTIKWTNSGSSLSVTGLAETMLTGQLDQLPAIYQHDACIAMAAAALFGVEANSIVTGSKDFRPLDLRLHVRAGRNDCSIINDSYSNDLTSLGAALQFAATQAPAEKVTLILSDLAQTGQSVEDTYTRVVQLLSEKVHRLLAVGPDSKSLATLLTKKTLSGTAINDTKVTSQAIEFHHYPDTETLLAQLDNHRFDKETILLKGARSFALERLMDKLTSRRHRTVLEVNLNALLHNLNVYRRALADGVGVAVMVKASAYGSGSVQVARLLADAGVAYLVVAYTDEGIRLREAGIETPIMVLNPENNELQLLLDFRLEPVLADLYNLAEILTNAPDLPFHLEFDTGMRRLGFEEVELPQIINLLQVSDVQPRSIFTHLAASESSTHDAFSRQQLATFSRIDQAFKAVAIEVAMRHVLNTNGISRFPEYAYEMVRLGIGLYGLGDRQKRQNLQPAISLKAAISGIRTIDGDSNSVGYGRKGKVGSGQQIAIVSIGYADGLPRLAGERKYSLLVNGHAAPIVGAVCMDMCMIDLTGIPAPAVDDEVIIFGPDHPIEALAEAAGTIPYEILTGVGARVHRVYVSE